jgi:hypothetical protein
VQWPASELQAASGVFKARSRCNMVSDITIDASKLVSAKWDIASMILETTNQAFLSARQRVVRLHDH